MQGAEASVTQGRWPLCCPNVWWYLPACCRSGLSSRTLGFSAKVFGLMFAQAASSSPTSPRITQPRLSRHPTHLLQSRHCVEYTSLPSLAFGPLTLLCIKLSIGSAARQLRPSHHLFRLRQHPASTTPLGTISLLSAQPVLHWASNGIHLRPASTLCPAA